jgi:hypothetical protein
VAVATQPSGEGVVRDPAKEVMLFEEAPIHLLQPPEAATVAAEQAGGVFSELALAARAAAVVLGRVFLHRSSA